MIASGVQDERRVVAVLTGMKSMQERADESANLLQWALSTFKNVKIFSEQKEIERVPVVWGTVDTVGLRVAQTLVVSMPKMESGNFSVEISYKTPLIAPLEEGQNIGTATVRIAGREDLSVPLLTVSSVPKADFMSLMLQKLRMMISG